MSSRSSVSTGVGFWPLLALVFITLKLCDVIAWSWWLVLLPLYGPLLFVGGFLGICFAIVLICGGVCGLAAVLQESSK